MKTDAFQNQTAGSSALYRIGLAVAGPPLCAMLALGVTWLSFAGFAPEILHRAILTSGAVTLGLSVPLFAYVACKLVELAAVNGRLRVIADTDTLTDCLTRRAFTTMVETSLDRLLPSGGPLHGALFIVDIDNFKQINDRFGHHHGDAALALIAGAVRASVRSGDGVGRLGGEEFGVFVSGIGRYDAENVAERLRRAVEKVVFIADGRLHPLSISVGGVVFDRKARFEMLFKTADERLYVAKRLGRNRVCLTHLPLVSKDRAQET